MKCQEAQAVHAQWGGGTGDSCIPWSGNGPFWWAQQANRRGLWTDSLVRVGQAWLSRDPDLEMKSEVFETYFLIFQTFEYYQNKFTVY